VSGTPESAPRLFVNYRREDTNGIAAALASTLRHGLERGEVFLDRDGIQGGEPWPLRLREELQRSTVVLVLIGARWLTAANRFGVRRLDHEDDWVRVEIAEALAAGKTVIPILLDGVPAPPREAFSTAKTLEALADRQAVEFSSTAWEDSVDKICSLLEQHGFRRAQSRTAPRPSASPIRSTVPPRGSAPFHGRDDLLTGIGRLLDGGSPLIVLHGAAGVGKSELAREFARRNVSRFPGGRFVVDMRASGPPVDLARLGWTILGLVYPEGMPLDAQCYQALLALGPESLLVYDNAQSQEQVERWLPPEGVLANVIVTTVGQDWDNRWRMVLVPPLEDSDARRIVHDLAGSLVPAEVAARLVRQSTGIPMKLIPAVLGARKLVARGGSLDALDDHDSPASFDHPWSVLDAEARLLLFACTFFHPNRISPAILESVFAGTMQWRRRRTEAAIGVAKDQGLLEGDDPLRMHQLLGRFVRERDVDLDRPAVDAIAGQFAGTLLRTAAAVVNNPASAEHTLALLSLALDLDVWRSTNPKPADAHMVGLALSLIGRSEEALPWLQHAADAALRSDDPAQRNQAGRSFHEVGFCLSALHRHEEAQQWFERALDAFAAGAAAGADHTYQARSMHGIGFCLSTQGHYEQARTWYERSAETAQLAEKGKVDNETISASLHQVGLCLIKLARPEEALPWFERARDATMLGDEQGRVDYESLGRTLAQIAYCLSRAGKYGEAIDISKRAVEAKERGDVHGRVDADSVGRSLHNIGDWLIRLDRPEDAVVWYERAADISLQGDVYGRVNHESIGRSLHQLGTSLLSIDRPDEARECLERALAEKSRGDAFGRIDEASIGLTRTRLASLHPPSHGEPALSR
jgi:tetratricopeptide (TPR) repeat protein